MRHLTRRAHPFIVRNDYARAMEAFQESLAEQKQQVSASPLVSLPHLTYSCRLAGARRSRVKHLTWNAFVPNACVAGCGRATRPPSHAPVAACAHARRAFRLARATRLPSLPSQDSSPFVGQWRAGAYPPIEAYAGPSEPILTCLLTRSVAPSACEQVCGVVQYVRTGTPSRCSGGSSERAAEPGCGKRKARHTIDGVLTEREISAWLKDVGGDDAMLEELLSVDGSDSGVDDTGSY